MSSHSSNFSDVQSNAYGLDKQQARSSPLYGYHLIFLPITSAATRFLKDLCLCPSTLTILN